MIYMNLCLALDLGFLAGRNFQAAAIWTVISVLEQVCHALHQRLNNKHMLNLELFVKTPIKYSILFSLRQNTGGKSRIIN